MEEEHGMSHAGMLVGQCNLFSFQFVYPGEKKGMDSDDEHLKNMAFVKGNAFGEKKRQSYGNLSAQWYSNNASMHMNPKPYSMGIGGKTSVSMSLTSYFKKLVE